MIKALANEHNGAFDVIAVPLARKLAAAAFLASRLVGVLVDRKGEIKWVIVGDASRLYLPDIGRIRGGKERLRGLRLLVARPHPLAVEDKQYTISHDFKTDLEKLRLDAVVELDASRDGVDGTVVLGHLAHSNDAVVTKVSVFRSVHDIKLPFDQLINSIEADVQNFAPAKPEKKSSFNDRAILVGVYQESKKSGHASMEELTELARSARVEVVEKVFQWRSSLYPKTVIGLGKLEEICLRALSLGVEMLIFDRDLTPSQLRNITDMTDLKILDRSMLILDIFAQRAVSREGKVQVEIAQLSYSLPRLAEKQAGLSRLTGGIGGRGPGETKLEVNRRRVKERLARLSDELDKIKMQRGLRRKMRQKDHVPTLAIVGYTNAGKSSLINALSGSSIYAKDELFATLDPHSRRLRFPNEQEVVVTDTVGFINHLPESLMKAFMATLEELYDADVLFHVVDIANENYLQQVNVVNEVLSELDLANKPTVLVLNKIDKLTPEEIASRKKILGGGIAISAHTKEGLDNLVDRALHTIEAYLTLEKSNKLSKRPQEDIIFDERKAK